ncbi:MAG: YIP1 family protein [Clostridia bacterium]|nr:YIP1 family protein [Clostridia bacterium]
MSDKDFNKSYNQDVITQEEDKQSKLSLFQRIMKLFTDPVEVMNDISLKPKILVPILLILIIFTLMNVLKIDFLKELMLEQFKVQMEGNPNVSQLSESIIMNYVYFALIMASIGPLLAIFSKGLISHGIVQLFEGKGKIKTSISVVAFSYFIVVFGEVVRTIITLLTKNYMVMTSPAAIMSNEKMGTPLYILLSSLDVFTIWYLIVSMIGISIVHKISKGKAAVAVFAPWILLTVFNVAMAVIRG